LDQKYSVEWIRIPSMVEFYYDVDMFENNKPTLDILGLMLDLTNFRIGAQDSVLSMKENDGIRLVAPITVQYKIIRKM
jgi:hypothetical protein